MENVIRMRNIRKWFFEGLPNELSILNGIDLDVKRESFYLLLENRDPGNLP